MVVKSGRLLRVGAKMGVSALLLWLALFMLGWGLENRLLVSGRDAAQLAQVLDRFPAALVRLGLQARVGQDAAGAADLFQKALRLDPLRGEAWLALAEIQAQARDLDQAGRLVDFTHWLGRHTLRWTWSETLLALDLERYELAWENLNRLITDRRHGNDALQLADVLLASEPDADLRRLEAPNLAPYLRWLTSWNRLDQALAVQREMAARGLRDADLEKRLAARLLSQKRVAEALPLSSAAGERLTNPGFEAPLNNDPFDWQRSDRGDPGWRITREAGAGKSGDHALAVIFNGQKNGSFAHLSQVVALTPGQSYQLSAWWRGRALSTDQGPFLEIYGLDAKGLYVKGPMQTGTWGWEQVALTFTAPPDCHAVVVRLRRLPSGKLDNKISGALWLDDVSLARRPHASP